MKFSKRDFRNLLKNEIKKMLDDDMLRSPPRLGDPHYATYRSKTDACPECGKSSCNGHDDQSEPPACGSCETQPCECGTTDIMERKLICSTCNGVLFLEGDCGCQGSVDIHVPEADIDYNQDHVEKPVAYMAKSQLHKIAKYAQKLQHMIPDGHDLEDWMRSHISQAADDIGEVYHKLDYQESASSDDH